MGRRKIEIQPITHERNRSVTFLKRKNGLFKKAYELGVLCSVDVAVVIFEERAGHHLKLYQYCSGDIHDIIQRHVRYDGEKDTRTPHDFANNTNAKLNNDAEVDDDDVDDDDDPDSAPIRGNRKRHESKLKAEYSNNPKLHIPPSGGDMGLSVDMADYHRPMTIPPPPMPIHHSSQLASAGGGSSLPISTERHTSSGRLLPPNGQLSSQKKPRLAPSVHAGNGSKLSGDESMYNGYLPSPTSAHPSAYRSNGPSSHQLPYNGYMGVSNNSPSQSFLPSSFDFPSSSSRGSNLPRNNSYSQRSSFSQPQEPQLQGMYHQLMRHNLPHGQHSHSSGLQSQQSPDNLLSTFLDNDEHRQPQGTGSQFAPLDWPTHGASQQPPPSTPSQPAQQESGPPGDTSWLDFLSQNAPQSSAQPLHMTLPPTHPNGRDGLSWERDHDAEHYSVERGAGAGGGDLSHPDKSPTSGGALMSPRSSRKRPRADSGGGNAAAADEKRPSPSVRAATVSGHDKIHDASSGAGIDKQDK